MGSDRNLNKFGGIWTEEKLNIFNRYLEAYLIALKNQPFKKIYIDAFAGSGEIETKNGNNHFIGSAKRSLQANEKFDHYYFIEKESNNSSKLQAMINEEFAELKERTTVLCGDANEQLKIIIKKTDWSTTRGLLFLDPYATQVDWETLPLVAETKAIDTWYLFPFYALNRMLSNNGINESHAKCVDRILGERGWRVEFYKDDPQLLLFNEFGEDLPCNNKIKTANSQKIKEYLIRRLKTVFPYVSEYPRIFTNSKNSAIFLFCFTISNPNPKAQGLAKRIANHILKNY